MLMFTLQLLGLIIIVILALSLLYAMLHLLVIYLFKKEDKSLIKTIYIITNETGNVFKAYEDELTRDIDLEGFRNMGFNFKAKNLTQPVKSQYYER